VLSEANGTPAKPSIDFLLEEHGSIVLLRPVTAAALAWVADNIGEENGYQAFWPTLTIEPRYVQPILDGIHQARMSCGVER
jgi:hypothetical protein